MYFFFYYEPLIALIGHLESNQSYEAVRQALRQVNRTYKDDLEESCTMVQNNEFHGLLKCGSNLMNLMGSIEEAAYPHKIYWGIGIGKSKKNTNPAASWEAQSRAFQNAQAAADFLVRQNEKKASFSADYRIVCDGDHEEVTQLLNTVLILLTSMKRRWTKHQYAVVADYRKHGGGQTKAAARLGIAQSSVQKSLAGADYYAYQEVMDTLNAVFSQIGEGVRGI